MAQWAHGYSGHTHGTKVSDLEEAMRQAIIAFSNAEEDERIYKSKAIHHLANRLIAARLKALRAQIARLREPDRLDDNLGMILKLQFREKQLESENASSILTEFGFTETQNV